VNYLTQLCIRFAKNAFSSPSDLLFALVAQALVPPVSRLTQTPNLSCWSRSSTAKSETVAVPPSAFYPRLYIRRNPPSLAES
jgi:hypothetical protein